MATAPTRLTVILWIALFAAVWLIALADRWNLATNPEAEGWGIVFVLLVMPALSLLFPLIDAILSGPRWLWILVVPAAFLSVMLVITNSSALMYTLPYTLLAAVGLAVGGFVRFVTVSGRERQARQR